MIRETLSNLPDDRKAQQEEIKKRAQELGVPVIPARNPCLDVPMPNPCVGICGMCGVEIRQLMMMACNRNGCPITRRIIA